MCACVRAHALTLSCPAVSQIRNLCSSCPHGTVLVKNDALRKKQFLKAGPLSARPQETARERFAGNKQESEILIPWHHKITPILLLLLVKSSEGTTDVQLSFKESSY